MAAYSTLSVHLVAGEEHSHQRQEIRAPPTGYTVDPHLLQMSVPRGLVLQQFKGKLPANLVIRRCPRLHAKAIIVDAATITCDPST